MSNECSRQEVLYNFRDNHLHIDHLVTEVSLVLGFADLQEAQGLGRPLADVISGHYKHRDHFSLTYDICLTMRGKWRRFQVL